MNTRITQPSARNLKTMAILYKGICLVPICISVTNPDDNQLRGGLERYRTTIFEITPAICNLLAFFVSELGVPCPQFPEHGREPITPVRFRAHPIVTSGNLASSGKFEIHGRKV